MIPSRKLCLGGRSLAERKATLKDAQAEMHVSAISKLTAQGAPFDVAIGGGASRFFCDAKLLGQQEFKGIPCPVLKPNLVLLEPLSSIVTQLLQILG